MAQKIPNNSFCIMRQSWDSHDRVMRQSWDRLWGESFSGGNWLMLLLAIFYPDMSHISLGQCNSRPFWFQFFLNIISFESFFTLNGIGREWLQVSVRLSRHIPGNCKLFQAISDMCVPVGSVCYNHKGWQQKPWFCRGHGKNQWMWKQVVGDVHKV